MQPYQIELTPAEFALLRNLSADTGKTMHELVSEALQQYAPDVRRTNGEHKSTLLERLNRKGLVGCLRGGPPDLSTNPIHMEGFGRD